MGNNVVLMKDRRPRGGYYYVFSSMSGGDLFDLLVGATLILAAPFFYSVITADIVPLAAYMACAVAAAALGLRSFVNTPDLFPQRLDPASRVRQMPSSTRSGRRDAA
jgi:hypothetical protein